MLTFIQKFKSRRSDEGFTLVELSITMLLMGMVVALFGLIVVGSSRSTMVYSDQQNDVNQEPVKQKTIDIGRAIEAWMQDNPEGTPTKERMEQEGVVSPSDDFIWNINLGGGNPSVSRLPSVLCVMAYSPSSTVYTYEQPAMYSGEWGWLSNGGNVDGCSGIKRNGLI